MTEQDFWARGWPHEYTLKIDLDVPFLTEGDLYLWIETRTAILNRLNLLLDEWNYAKTKHGWHFWFKIRARRSLTDRELALLQLLLGDDHRRACFNLVRAEAGSFKVFNVLFSKKLRKKWPMEKLILHVLRLIIAWSLFETIRALHEEVEI